MRHWCILDIEIDRAAENGAFKITLVIFERNNINIAQREVLGASNQLDRLIADIAVIGIRVCLQIQIFNRHTNGVNGDKVLVVPVTALACGISLGMRVERTGNNDIAGSIALNGQVIRNMLRIFAPSIPIR